MSTAGRWRILSQRVLQLHLSCQVAGGGGIRSLNGEDVHVESEVPLGMFLPTGIPWRISSSTAIILRIFPVVVLLPVGEIPQ